MGIAHLDLIFNINSDGGHIGPFRWWNQLYDKRRTPWFVMPQTLYLFYDEAESYGGFTFDWDSFRDDIRYIIEETFS